MKNKTRILFRADGNSQIGLGHVIRSLALADMLQNDFECHFAIQNPTKALLKQLNTVCKEILNLPERYNEYELIEEANSLAETFTGQEIIVLDGYQFSTEYQQILKQKGHKLVCIDDLHAFHFVADLIINHAPGTKPELYDAETYTRFCLGPEFALLRKPFISAKPKVNNSGLETAFICFGGADPKNLTITCLLAISGNPEIKTIHVVVGSSYQFAEQLKKEKAEIKNCEIIIHQDLAAAEMKELMDACQVAICPASSVLMEALSCKLKAITGYYVENQREFATYCQENGYCLSIGNFLNKNADELQFHLKQLLKELATFEPKAYILGNPAVNLREQFLKLSTTF